MQCDLQDSVPALHSRRLVFGDVFLERAHSCPSLLIKSAAPPRGTARSARLRRPRLPGPAAAAPPDNPPPREGASSSCPAPRTGTLRGYRLRPGRASTANNL